MSLNMATAPLSESLQSRTSGTSSGVLVTIVTVSYNAGPAIRRTIESVMRHLDDEVEYVVVDGGSSDGTADIIREYASSLAIWLSEPDRGIYDAMNKAVVLARGRFILNVNCGDELLAIPKEELRQTSESVGCVAFPVKQGTEIFRPSAGLMLRIHNTLHHQGCFYARSMAPQYDLRYRVFSDFALNLKIKLAGVPIQTGTTIVASHDKDGVSNNTNRFGEVYSIVREQGGTGWVVVCFLYFKWKGIVARIRKVTV